MPKNRRHDAKALGHPVSGDAVPGSIASALDASAEDLRAGRIEEIAGFLRRMEAKLDRFMAEQEI